MNLMSIDGIAKYVRDQALFSDVVFGIDHSDKIGFIGPNGAGKSTLMNILTGKLPHDEGEITRNNDLRISILEQLPQLQPDLSIREQLYLSDDPRVQLLKDYHRAAEEGSDDLEELTHRVEQEGCWTLEKEYLSYLTELGITDTEQLGGTLSGGMTKKVAMARMMASGANLLFLDEPTNHLDIDTIEWLETWLRKTRAAFVMVTHDRYFLDSVCNTIMELDRKKIYKYPGSYSVALKKKRERLDREAREQSRIEAILKMEMAWLAQGPKARASKDKKRKMNIENLMDSRVEAQQQMAEFTSGNRRLGKRIIDMVKVEKHYGDRQVIAPFSYRFKKGERIGIIGPNGSGKTTFLDMITERLPIDSGRIERGVNTHFGYFDQMSRPMNPEQTLLDYIREISDRITMPDGSQLSAAGYLERFLFTSSIHRQKIKRLSGGERRRLYLARVLMDSPNFLILDEPTNDLDMDTLDLLEEYVDKFDGCLLIVSHDRAFLDRTTDYLFVFKGDGNILGFSGSYSDYREARREEEREAELAARKTEPPAGKQVNREKKGLSFKEKRELESLTEEIMVLEEEKTELEGLFSTETDAEKLGEATKRYNELGELIPQKEERWAELAEREG
ncbi:MAG: ABC-F family ATP-binding cassette domain-containing protein [Spirochaetales bacterium]|nr:ABC-F family ATP-binding cassette domain-containing protein [Spirochaetales bacterium]